MKIPKETIMSSTSNNAKWLKLLKLKFQKQVGSDSRLVADWLRTAISGVERKGEKYYRQAVQKFLDVDSMRILDAGCGDGAIALRFAIAGADVTGLDIDCEFIEIARSRSLETFPQTPIKFICADLCDKEVNINAGFDLIISIDVIEHVSNAARYLSVLKAMLNPGGKIWLFTPNRFSLGNIVRDPHYKLTGLTLMPNTLAAWYAVYLRRKTGKYEVEKLYTQYSLKKLVEECELKITYQSDADFEAFITKQGWLKYFVRVSIVRGFIYFIYKQRMSTIEGILS